jgi:hypothetical protein
LSVITFLGSEKSKLPFCSKSCYLSNHPAADKVVLPNIHRQRNCICIDAARLLFSSEHVAFYCVRETRRANIRKNHCNSIRFTYHFISLNSYRISVISHPISVNAHFISLNSHHISANWHLVSHVISLNSLFILLISVISPLISVISPLISLNAFLAFNSIRGEYKPLGEA